MTLLKLKKEENYQPTNAQKKQQIVIILLKDP